MGKNVGTVAAEAVKKSEKVKASERTDEQILKDIRRNLDAHLSVTPDDVRFLLARYDNLVIFQNVAVANDILKTALIERLDAELLQIRTTIAATTVPPTECGTLTEQPIEGGLCQSLTC